MDITTQTLSGNLIDLEVLRANHLEDYFLAAQDPEIWKFMPFDLSDKAMLRMYIDHVATQPEKGEAVGYVIRHKASGRVIGASGYWHIDHQHCKLEIGGSWIGRAFQRTGVNTEAKYLLLNNAFENLGCTRIAFSIDERNLNSITAIERIGATKEGILRGDMLMHDGSIRNSVVYSVLGSEWPEVKKRLKGFLAT